MLNTSQHPQLLTLTLSGIILADLKPYVGKKVECIKSMDDWCLKAEKSYTLKWDEDGDMNTGGWIGDDVALYTMSQTELNNLKLLI